MSNPPPTQLTIFEATIPTLTHLLSTNQITAVDLLAKHLLRLCHYDTRNTCLNSIPLLSSTAFDDAAASDDRRATSTASLNPLDGIPFTVKDSYKVRGMTVASGSMAFKDLIANEDAFLVERLRAAGAVLVGKTNMCPMAYGGMLRGVYGRAESPYNPDYLAAAFGSGSSNGSGVSTAASFAAFGLGGETVSSGRSPGSNNALVTYTPSRGLISVRGTWPLYPTCDVAISHTRSVDDLLVLLDVLVQKDNITTGDFWRDQPWVKLGIPEDWPPKRFTEVKDTSHLKGKRIAVPEQYIKKCENGPYIADSIFPLWEQTRKQLETAGAEVEVVQNFTTIQDYLAMNTDTLNNNSSLSLPPNWNSVERGALIAHAWEDFLQSNQSAAIPSLTSINPTDLFPQLPRSDPQVRFTEPRNAISWSTLPEHIKTRTPSQTHSTKSPIFNTPHLSTVLQTLESARQAFFESYLTRNGYDYVVFPSVGDVARSNADIDIDSARHAWTDGVQYSHGVRALRHLGIPSVTVPMGMLPMGMPIGMTILGRAYADVELLKMAGAFEEVSRMRVSPAWTPMLSSDVIPSDGGGVGTVPGPRPGLDVRKCEVMKIAVSEVSVCVEGIIEVPSSYISQSGGESVTPQLDIYIDGNLVDAANVQIQALDEDMNTIKFSCECTVPAPPEQDERNSVQGKIARDSTIVMILARMEGGRPSGYLKVIHRSDALDQTG